jgi:hypothetical protein
MPAVGQFMQLWDQHNPEQPGQSNQAADKFQRVSADPHHEIIGHKNLLPDAQRGVTIKT